MDCILKSRKRWNQTLEHEELANRSIIWLGNRATFKGMRWSVEIQVKDGYIADAVALCSLQIRFFEQFTGRKLLTSGEVRREICRRHNLTISKDLEKIRELEEETWAEMYKEFPANEFIFIFEAKATRQDFLNTFKKDNHNGSRLEPVGHFHFCVTPRNLVNPEELPKYWGLLEAHGKGLKISKMAEYHPATREEVHRIGYEILWHQKSDRVLEILNAIGGQ